MEINGVNSTSQMASASSQAADKTDLNYDSFLKLFVEALKNQDPMAPMQQSEMMGQLSQLSQMENNMKLVNIVETMGNQLVGSKMSQYASFIGKEVTVISENDQEVSGVVKMISNDSGVVKATLDNGHEYEVERIKEIYE